MLNKTRMRFARRRTKPVDGALAALATLSCCISTVDPKNASAWEPDDGCSPEQQLINRTMHALQRNLEAPLLRTGWKTGNERPARPHLPFAGSREPIHPLTMAPSARIDKIDVPGVPLAIQLSHSRQAVLFARDRDPTLLGNAFRGQYGRVHPGHPAGDRGTASKDRLAAGGRRA